MQQNTGAKQGKFKSSELALRIVSGVFMAGFSVFVTWKGGLTFALFVAVLSVFILLEYLEIVSQAIDFKYKILSWAFWALVLISFFVADLYTTAGLFLIAIVSIGALELFSRRSLWCAGGLIYALVPFLALVQLRGTGQAGFVLVTILFFCVWATDSFGYLVGKPVGGPKLAPAISPNKTWSGSIGGLFGGALLSFIVAWAFGYQPGMILAGFALVLSFFSQLGDLVESALKRKFDVKDSGAIIPGHGGVLDRIDGLIFAAVAAWIGALMMEPDILGAVFDKKNLADNLVRHILTPISGV